MAVDAQADTGRGQTAQKSAREMSPQERQETLKGLLVDYGRARQGQGDQKTTSEGVERFLSEMGINSADRDRMMATAGAVSMFVSSEQLFSSFESMSKDLVGYAQSGAVGQYGTGAGYDAVRAASGGMAPSSMSAGYIAPAQRAL